MKTDVIDPAVDAPARSSPKTLQSNLRSAWLRELEQAQLAWWAVGRRPAAPGTAAPRDPHGSENKPADREPSGHGALERTGNSAVLAELGAGRQEPPRADAGVDPEAFEHEPASQGQREDDPTSAATRAQSGPGAARSAKAAGGIDTLAAGWLAAADRIPYTAPVSVAAMDVGLHSANPPDPRASEGEAPLPGAAASVPREPLPARAVHLMVDGSGAKVWIRDNDLTQARAGEIVASLAAELAERGLRLRALTVNGRVAFEAASAFQRDEDAMQPADVEEAGRLRKINAFTSAFSERKG